MLLIEIEKKEKKVTIAESDWRKILQRLRKVEKVTVIDPPKRPTPLEELIGLGKELWRGIDPVEYQRAERSGW